MTPELCLGEALAVMEERQEQYGEFTHNLENIASLWSAYLNTKITRREVAIMLVLFKFSRTSNYKLDTYIDAINYLAAAAAEHATEV